MHMFLFVFKCYQLQSNVFEMGVNIHHVLTVFNHYNVYVSIQAVLTCDTRLHSGGPVYI